MNSIIIEGVVIEKTPTTEFTDKAGRTHTENHLLVETEEMYPQQIAVRLMDDLEKNSPMVGSKVRCYLNFRVSKGTTGKWFNDIKAWRIDL